MRQRYFHIRTFGCGFDANECTVPFRLSGLTVSCSLRFLSLAAMACFIPGRSKLAGSSDIWSSMVDVLPSLTLHGQHDSVRVGWWREPTVCMQQIRTYGAILNSGIAGVANSGFGAPQRVRLDTSDGKTRATRFTQPSNFDERTDGRVS